PWNAITLGAQLAAKPCAVATERFSSVSAELALHAGEWRLHGEVQRLPEETLTIEGTGVGTRRVSADVRSTAWALSGFRALRESIGSLEGTAILAANLTGTIWDPDGHAELRLTGVTMGERQVGTSVVEINSAADAWLVEMNASDGRLTAHARVGRAAGYPFAAEAAFHS